MTARSVQKTLTVILEQLLALLVQLNQQLTLDLQCVTVWLVGSGWTLIVNVVKLTHTVTKGQKLALHAQLTRHHKQDPQCATVMLECIWTLKCARSVQITSTAKQAVPRV